MFYLGHFFKSVKLIPVRFLVLITLTSLFAFASGFGHYYDEKVVNFLRQKEETGGHFFVLTPATSGYETAIKKLSELPDVKKIEFISKDKLAQKMQQLIQSLGDGINADSKLSEMVAVKIVFASTVTQKGRELVRDYFVSLMGETTLIMGPLRQAEKSDSSQFWKGLQRNWLYYLLGMIYLLWLASLLTFSLFQKKNSFLIEQFQRKKRVFFKSTLSSMLITATIVIALLSIVMGAPSYLGLVIVIVAIIGSLVIVGVKKTSGDQL